MANKTLQLIKYKKQYGGHSGTWDHDVVADYLFSIRPEDGSAPPTVFWTEVRLRQSLLNRVGWGDLSVEGKFKALYLFAVEQLKKAGGRPIRQMSLGWVPKVPYADGPCWEIGSVNLDRPAPVTIEGDGIQPVVVHQH